MMPDQHMLFSLEVSLRLSYLALMIRVVQVAIRNVGTLFQDTGDVVQLKMACK